MDVVADVVTSFTESRMGIACKPVVSLDRTSMTFKPERGSRMLGKLWKRSITAAFPPGPNHRYQKFPDSRMVIDIGDCIQLHVYLRTGSLSIHMPRNCPPQRLIDVVTKVTSSSDNR